MRQQFDHNRVGPSGWVYKLVFGLGAGYIGLFSSTLYIAWRSGSRDWALRHRDRKWYRQHYGWHFGPLEMGWTRNANAVPYTSH